MEQIAYWAVIVVVILSIIILLVLLAIFAGLIKLYRSEDKEMELIGLKLKELVEKGDLVVYCGLCGSAFDGLDDLKLVGGLSLCRDCQKIPRKGDEEEKTEG